MQESWEINSAEHFKSFFKLHIVNSDDFNNEYELINNLSYNFQYLQFLTNLLKREDLREVIWRLNIKTYVIVSTSIIECILDYYLILIGEYKTSDWIEIEKSKSSSNTYIIGKSQLKNVTITHKKTKRFLVKMKFDDVLKKIKDKQLLGENNELYKSLYKIKKLTYIQHNTNICYHEGKRI